MPEARASFPPELASATAARHFTEQMLDRWSLGEARDTVRLLVSELVVNAVLHAGTPVDLCLRDESGVLVVEVSDGSTVSPVVGSPSPTAATGRGLQILDRLSDDWGVDIGADGKTVWFRYSAPAAGGDPTASELDRRGVRR